MTQKVTKTTASLFPRLKNIDH